MDYIKSKTLHYKLAPFIEDYTQACWKNSPITSKDIQPRPGASLLFCDKALWIGNKKYKKPILIGIQDKAVQVKTDSDSFNAFVVHLSSYGLSCFTPTITSNYFNKVIDADLIFTRSINEINNSLFHRTSFQNKIEIVEDFLLEKFKTPSPTDEKIFNLAQNLLAQFQATDFSNLKKEIPMSTRNIERKFKRIVGVSIQKFIRLSRFHHAKDLITENSQSRMIDICYDTGYFDQPHFSKEFKAFSKVKPKDFLFLSPYYKILSERKLPV